MMKLSASEGTMSNSVKDKKSRQKFVVLTHPRSGSSLLINGLRQHESIIPFGELFSDHQDDRAELPQRVSIRNPNIPAKFVDGMDGGQYLAALFDDAVYPKHIQSIGCKVFFTQCRRGPLEVSLWNYLLRRDDIKIIRLYRHNLLRSWVSLQRAFRTGVWSIAADAPTQIACNEPELVSPFDLDGFIKEQLHYWEWADRVFKNHAQITIEYATDLCGDGFLASMNNIFSFLGVEPTEVCAGLKKLEARPVHQIVSNYSEIIRHFDGSPEGKHIFDDTCFNSIDGILNE